MRQTKGRELHLGWRYELRVQSEVELVLQKTAVCRPTKGPSQALVDGAMQEVRTVMYR